MIQVTNLTKVFRGETDVTALTGINLNVDDGDIYGIIGMSGAGKSTLLRCIALLETPTQGRIEVDGVDISTLQGKDLTALRKSVGVIFQGYNLLMQRNVLRNVCFPLELDGVKKEAREARAMELLNVVGLADKAFDMMPVLLSRARETIAACPCEKGCPSCVGTPSENGKRDAVTLIGRILDEQFAR